MEELAQAGFPPSSQQTGGGPDAGAPAALSPLDLAGAGFAQFGSTLIVTTAGGQSYAVPGFFSGPDIGLPPGFDPEDIVEISPDDFVAVVAAADPATQQQIAALGGNQSEGAVDELLDEVAKEGDDETPPEELETAAGGPNNGPVDSYSPPDSLDAGERFGAGSDGGDGGVPPDTRGVESSLGGSEDLPLIGPPADDFGGPTPQLLSALSFGGPDGHLGVSRLAALAPVASEFAGGGGKSPPGFDSPNALVIELEVPQGYDFSALIAAIDEFTNPPEDPPRPPPSEGDGGPGAAEPDDGVPPEIIVFRTDQTHAEIDRAGPGELYLTFTGTPTELPYSAYLPGGYFTTFMEGIPARFDVSNLERASNFEDLEGTSHSLTAPTHYYTPDHRHGFVSNIVVNANLTSFRIEDDRNFDNVRAFPSVAVDPEAPDTLVDNAPDLISYQAGVEDVDWVSFYDRADPHGGDGNYSLSDPVSYSKLHNIEVIDAGSFGPDAPDGYGTNDVRLKADAIRSMTWVQGEVPVVPDAGGEPVPGADVEPDFLFRKLVVLGDPVDSVALTDESQWAYTGIVDADALTVLFYVVTYDAVTDTYFYEDPTEVSTLPTRTQFGTALYEFTYVGDNGMATILWISDDFGTHPDFYWTGTDGDDTAEFPDARFGAVDALGGFDILFMNNAEAALVVDFTGTGGTIDNFEAVSVADNDSADDVTMDRQFVADATDAGNFLFVYGDAGDTLNLAPGDDWLLAGRLNDADADDTYIYQSQDGGTATVYADVDLTVNGTGIVPATSGDDSLFVNHLAFGPLDGLDGFDRLGFLHGGGIDLTGLVPGNSIANIEVFDLTNGVANDLIFDALTMDLFGGSELYIVGDAAGDALTLTDAPSWTRGATFAAGDFNLVGFTTNQTGTDLQLWVDENLV